jgi:transposase
VVAQRKFKARARQSEPRPQATPGLAEEVALVDYLNLPGLRTLPPVEERDFSIWVKAEQFPKLVSCPTCGCANEKQFIKNGTYPQTLRHAPRGLKSVYVEVQRQCYLCRQCNTATRHPLTTVHDKWRETPALVEYIGKMALLCTQAEVSRLSGLPTKTVREILADYCEHLEATVKFETPRVLGLDGVHARVEPEETEEVQQGKGAVRLKLVIGKMRRKKSVRKECICVTDIGRGFAIDLWPGATKNDVIHHLKQIPYDERIKIRIVVIDMSPVLRAAVKEALPWAVIVIDQFHILKKANEGIDKVRKRLRAKTRRVKGQLTMCKRELLRKHRDPCKPRETPAELKLWFERFPELRMAYEVKESCFEIRYSSCKQTALRRYRRWLQAFPLELRGDFKQLRTSLREWEEEIFNYFEHRFTNAFTEERNRLVKDILRETRGCHFRTLRARVIYGSWLKRQLELARIEEMQRKKRKPRPRTENKRRRKKVARPEAPAESIGPTAVNSAQSIAMQMDLF